jgi:hypothetical protein
MDRNSIVIVSPRRLGIEGASWAETSQSGIEGELFSMD